MSLTRVGRRVTRIFDQYSVICVFGSVFGCVVVPLLTQSVETLIFSAIVISLTAKRILMAAAKDPVVQDERRKAREKDERKVKRSKKVTAINQSPQGVDVEQQRRQREGDLKKLEENRKMEKERKLEERREKKARRKEERSRLKEEENREKEREEKFAKQIREERALQKQQDKEIKAYLTFHSFENIKSAIASEKPLRRERKNSTSSSASSGSAHSSNVTHPQRSHRAGKHNHRQPTRASSDPQLAGSSPSPPPMLHPHAHTLPTQNRGWQTLPDPQGSPPWCPDLPVLKKTTTSTRQKKQTRHHSTRGPQRAEFAPQLMPPVVAQVHPSPPHYYGNQHASPPNWGSGTDSKIVHSKSPQSHSVVSPFPVPQRSWVSGPQSAPANLTGRTIPIGTPLSSFQPAAVPCYTTAGEAFSGGDLSPVTYDSGSYSLFSNEQSPFSAVLLSGSEGVSSGNTAPLSSRKSQVPPARGDQGKEFDEWPSF